MANNEFFKAVALKNLGEGRWIFKCENGKKYIENLSVALDRIGFENIDVGKEFYIDRFIVENASTEV
jgi:hypothetical protein